MFNVQSFVRHYTFADGDKTIATKDPSMEDYQTLTQINMENIGTMTEVMDDALNNMLYDEDKHYIKELPPTAKLALIIDYLQFHTGQLEATFPGAVGATPFK